MVSRRWSNPEGLGLRAALRRCGLGLGLALGLGLGLDLAVDLALAPFPGGGCGREARAALVLRTVQRGLCLGGAPDGDAVAEDDPRALLLDEEEPRAVLLATPCEILAGNESGCGAWATPYSMP